MSEPTNAATAPAEKKKWTKSRNGCQSCKKARRKCDEEKPTCGYCKTQRLSCLYRQNLKWVTRHEMRTSTATDDDTTKDTLATHFDLVTEVLAPAQPAAPAAPPSPLDLKPEESGFEEVGSSTQISTIARSSIPSRVTALPASRQLLRSYYRLSAIPSPNPISDSGTMLVEHYFKDVAKFYSSFDGALNPFRKYVAQAWSSSASMSYAIQAMAAAHLSNQYDSMVPVGLQLKQQAHEHLQQDMQLFYAGKGNADLALMTTLLLGLSACWHNTADLGLDCLMVARQLMYPRLLDDSPKTKEQERRNRFFEEALIYWEMMMAFVTPDSNVHQPGTDSSSQRLMIGDSTSAVPLPKERSLPHPWTGVAPKSQMLFAEVGRLVRAERLAQASVSLGEFDAAAIASQTRYSLAEALEAQLLSLEPPDPATMIDPGDAETTAQDFIVIAEATRLSAILEIYQVFPALLQLRLGCHAEDQTELLRSLDPSGLVPESSQGVDFTNALAIHIISLIRQLSEISGTRFQQLMLLVVAACALRYSTAPSPTASGAFSLPHDLSADIRVAAARDFALRRLQNHASRLPAKPIFRMIELVQEVWRQLDAGLDAFWLDVMIANGWETVMG